MLDSGGVYRAHYSSRFSNTSKKTAFYNQERQKNMDALKRLASLINVLVLLSVSTLAQSASETALNIDASLGISDNVTRAVKDNDIEHDTFMSVGTSVSHTLLQFNTGQVVLNLDVAGTAFNEFSGLSHIDAGGGINYSFSPWTGFGAPWFSIDAQYKVLEFDSFLRDSNLFITTGTFGKRIDDRTDMRVALEYQSRDSEGVAFDTENVSAFVNFDFTLKKKMTLYTTIKYQDGDVVSSANPGIAPGNLDPALQIKIINAAPNALEFDDVFEGKVAYRLDGTTQLYTVGLNIAQNLDSAFDLSVRFLTSEADIDSDLNYQDLTVRLSYFHRVGI